MPVFKPKIIGCDFSASPDKSAIWAPDGCVKTAQRGVVARAFVLANRQDGAAVTLADGRTVMAWAQARHTPGQAVEVVDLGGGEWAVLGVWEQGA